MDYKQKYEQALDNLKKIKAANKDNKELVDFIEYKYPELKESEDERLKKKIISAICYYRNDCCISEDDFAECRHWIEVQGRKTSANWNEEDSRILYNVKSFIGYAAGLRGVKDELFKEANEWLNSLPIGFIHNENYNEDMVTLLVNELKQIANNNNAPKQYQMEINWLKSLRPQPKNEWSDDDEVMFRTAKKIIFESDDCSEGTSSKAIDWLKSLKQRIKV